MSYLVLARKYRPQDFLTVTGQEQVTRTLGNAIVRNKVAHAHLFCGPRGVGKTSIARIFAKALNCEKGPTAKPCLECRNCQEIAAGTSLAVREIDGASHNSVDNVRELIESFRSLPAPGSRYKVYIIDEVHMLSVAAFNALLKSLEEPPPNTVFILATTEVHKIPETVISRCVRHDFRALSGAQVEARLQEVCAQEKITIEGEVLRMIARLADGSMRDAQSLLDRVHSFCEGTITAVEASKVLGTVERSFLLELSGAVLGRKPDVALKLIGEVFSRGVDPTVFLKEFVAHWRELLIGAFAGEQGLHAIGVSDEESVRILAQIKGVSGHDIQDLVHLAREGADSAVRSSYVKYALEALVVRLATREPVHEIGEIIEALKSSTNRQSGARPQPAASTPPAPVERGGGRPSPAPTNGSTGSAGRAVASATTTQTAQPIPQEQSEKKLEWGAFVQFAAANGARILCEHLKRISVLSFVPGALHVRGPKFSIASLKNGDSQEKLKQVLSKYSGITAWKIAFEETESGDEPESLHRSEQDARERKRRETQEQLSNHPKIKSLQRAFPGSSIEGIKIKE